MRTFFKYFFWILTILIAVAIFSFSSQVAKESQRTSQGLTRKVLSAFSVFRQLPEEKQEEIVESLQFLVRKTAHFSAYAALGISLFSALLLTFRKRFLWLYAFLASLLYAVSDEIHQYFVPGRSMELRDVLIDSSGAITGILLVLIIITLYKKKRMHCN